MQGAYALTDHLGIIGSYSLLSENRNDPQNTAATFKRKNNYYEAGLGWYNTTRSRRVELYAGYGQGESTTTGQYIFLGLGQQEVIVTGNLRKYFIQPSIGTNKRGFNLSFTPRFSFVDFYEFVHSGVPSTPDEKIAIFIEPAVTAKFKLTPNLDGLFQLGLNFAGSGEVFFDHVPLQAGFGIQLHLGESLKTRVY